MQNLTDCVNKTWFEKNLKTIDYKWTRSLASFFGIREGITR